MEIQIDNRQKRHPLPTPTVLKKAQAVLNALGNPEAELSVVITDDDEITQLNETYLKRTGPTNVISFPMTEGEFGRITPNLLGDVVISMDTAWQEAKQAGLSLEERFTQLLIHGILHLVGYDHEHDEQQAREMEKKEAEILAILKKTMAAD